MSIDIASLGALATSLVLIYILWLMSKKNVDFGIRTILAMVMGLILGIVFQGKMDYVAPIGKIYVKLITAIVVPLLFVSIFSSITSLKDITKLRTIGVRAIFWLMFSTFIAAILGIFIGSLFNVGNGMEIVLTEDYTAREVPLFTEVIIDLFPTNIISDASENKIIPIIIFSVLIGVAEILVSSQNPEITKPFKNVVESFQAIINMIVSLLVELTPYAVLSLIANAAASNGSSKLIPLIYILTSSYLACIIYLFIICGLLVLVFAKLNPIKFFKKMWTAIVVAFTSQSSMGTLPITIECLNKKVGVSENISSFVAPLGTTMGMPGCAGIWPTILAITSINALGLDYTLSEYVVLVLITVIVSMGTVGVPGTATITTTAIFTAVGLPIEIIVITTPISAIVDMIRTATNVTSSATVTVLVAKSQNEINMEVFNS